MKSISKFRKIVLTIISFIILNVSYSQENYVTGYIMKSKVDTLHGFIDYREWSKNPDEINFKYSANSKPISFWPSNIVEFGVQDEIYVSAIIETDISSTNINNYDYNSKPIIKIITAFLQTLIKGDESLYYYKSPKDLNNYYIKKGNKFELLVYKEYFKMVNDKETVVNNKKYMKQLSTYLKDCNSINSKLVNTLYTKDDLTKLFNHYYNCTSSDFVFNKKIEEIKTEFGLLVGASLTTIKFEGPIFPYLVNTKYSPSPALSTGLFIEFLLPRNHNQWSIYSDLLYTSFSFNGSYHKKKNSSDYYTKTTELDFSYIKIGSLVRYKFSMQDTGYLFINAGLSNGLLIKEKNYLKEERTYYTSETITEGLALSDARKHEQSLVIGGGIKRNKFSFEARFEKGNGISTFNNLTSTTNKYYFLCGYQFL